MTGQRSSEPSTDDSPGLPADEAVDDTGRVPPLEFDAGPGVDDTGSVICQETAYAWNLADDTLTWDEHASRLFDVTEMGAISTGAGFAMMIAPEHVERRSQAFNGLSAEGDKGVPYRLQYRLQPGGPRSGRQLVVEDHGRWWADADGKASKARGVIRIADSAMVSEQKLSVLNDHDELTGQLTRARLTDALAVVIDRSLRTGRRAGFLMLSIDNLVVVNETFGFDIGDELIGAIGRLLRSRMRGGDTIGRFSSNKFGLIVNDCTREGLATAAIRLAEAVGEAIIPTSACQLTATVSLGGVMIPAEAVTVSSAVNNAMQALDRARSSRASRFHAYQPSHLRESQRRRNIALADEVFSAVDENRLELAVQPIVEARSRRTAMFEALLRLRRRDGSIVPAADFFQVSEQLGLSGMLDRRSLQLALELLSANPDLRLSLNVSSRTAQDMAWLANLVSRAGQGDRACERLTIEITETSVIDDLDHAIAFVKGLKAIGCRVAIDDFGAGYTSFRNLKLLPVDMVKIDGGFLKNLATDDCDRVFVKTLAELARTFDMETVAEWVGDEDAARICVEAGITHLQGYLTGRPILAREAVAEGLLSAPVKLAMAS